MKNNWKKILNELSYRVSSGIPDLSNEQHLIKLWDVLKEHNWSVDARVELLKNLQEIDFKDKLAGQLASERGYSEQQREKIIPYLSPYLGVFDEAF